MTEAETSLINTMMLVAASKAADYCRDRGYPPPTEEQTAEMSQLWQKAFTGFVSNLAFERELTEAENEQMEEIVEGAAQGAVLRVIGQPPGSQGSQN